MGNFRVKWATSDQIADWLGNPTMGCSIGGESQVVAFEKGCFGQALEQLFECLDTPKSVWISNVAGTSLARDAIRVCKKFWKMQPSFVATPRYNAIIENGYLEPTELGVDRWLAMVGARVYTGSRPVVVIDAGTAITIDYVDADGVFSGGVIFPGLTTMTLSLNQSTSRIRVKPAQLQSGRINLQGFTTESAVKNGIMHAAISAIDAAVDCYEKINGDIAVIISGGDALEITKLSRFKMLQIPKLVLAGLSVISGTAEL